MSGGEPRPMLRGMRWTRVALAVALSISLSSVVACQRHHDPNAPHHEKESKKKKKKKRGHEQDDEPAATAKTAAATTTPGAPVAGTPDTRRFKFNGRDATEGDLATLKKV